jgi:hypothetical protein
MQYLLSEDEYNDLVPKSEYEALKSAMIKARHIIIALNTGKLFTPQCRSNFGYCNECPISPFHKDADTFGITHQDSNLICIEPKAYGK